MPTIINGDDALGYLIAYGVFLFISTFFTVLAIFKRLKWHGRLRLLSVLAFGVGASFPTIIFDLIRTSSSPRLPVAVRASFGLVSIAGMFATVYCFIIFFFIHSLRKPKGGVILRPGSKPPRRSTFFYMLLIDLAILTCLLASVVLTGSQLPWTFGACNSASNHDSIFVRALETQMTRDIQYRKSPAAIFDDRKEACKSAVAIQFISTLMSVQIAMQSVMLLPIVAFPPLLRLVFFIGIRYVRRPYLKLRDEELGPAEHPADCNGGKKSQCWACDAIICTNCKTKRFNVTAPRTAHHVTDCYAVCTMCYLTKWSAQPAALSEALHPTDLAKHHADCGLAKLPVSVNVELCVSCSGKSAEDLTAVRERREEVMLQRLLARRIFCAKCEKPVPKEKRRWWICATGDHECHWGGHEPGR